jgi:hypothetical protein
METIGKTTIYSFLKDKSVATTITNLKLRGGPSHYVKSYLELATKVAELQYLNRDHVLLFRGQAKDYRNLKRNTSLKPSLFRAENGSSRNPDQTVLQRRFEKLKVAEQLLVEEYDSADFTGKERLRRQQILRWSILQHYEVCRTPLLDVTHSLRIAMSFASHEAKNDQAFLFVVGVPNLSGSVTASAEAGLQIIRLSSVCPSSAIRPHIQEGYLLGEYPDIGAYEQKAFYQSFEIDFGRRLVAKFTFNPNEFWKQDDFPIVSRSALYPDSHDPLFKLVKNVRNTLER